MADRKLVQAVEAYFTDLRLVRGSGGATDERSLYVPLANLLDAVGATLKPRVFCVLELADQGAGHPDFGLYTTRQVQKGKPKPGQKPERGVIEVKPVSDDAWLTAASDQATGYWKGYRQVLATNSPRLCAGRNLRARCRHFGEWINRLEGLAHGDCEAGIE